MNNRTTEQSRINRKLGQRKTWLQLNYPLCILCGHRADNGDMVHLIRRSDRLPGVSREQLQTYPKNVWLGHRDCHEIFDNDQAQAKLLPQYDLVVRLIDAVIEELKQTKR